jgi:hypothetical protein
MKREYTSMAFLLFENKNPTMEIWKLIKPNAENSFFGYKDEQK